jgi:transposase
MSTKRTAKEAETYINESIQLWKSKGIEKRIISLSNWAECWRVRGESTEAAAEIKILESNKRSLQRVINNSIKIGMETGDFQVKFEEMSDLLKRLKSSYKQPRKRPRKTNK